MKICVLSVFTLFALSFQCLKAQEYSDLQIIPRPQSIEKYVGSLSIGSGCEIKIKGFSKKEVEVPYQILKEALGSDVKAGSKVKKSVITLEKSKNNNFTHKDEYILEVGVSGVKIVAQTTTGILYGCQTLRQLIPLQLKNGLTGIVEIPYLKISDYPRFEWRGYMKDVSRTFYSVDIIRKYLDVMSMYKLNIFHFHLTDDQGWRIEIKKYPELTSEKTTVFDQTHRQPKERSGFYTQDEIRDIVDYASKRGITIVPEIDVPGHCWPVILVKPELGSNKNTQPSYLFPFMSSWGYWGHQFTANPLDPTNEQVYTFLDHVFTEVAALFPGEYIHFGGDEVVHKLWESEPHIVEFMKNKGMKRVEELQSYFVKRVSQMIGDKGKKPIGWNDILADVENLPRSTAIMSWLGRGAVQKAASHGHYTVATPSDPLYFDITQSSRDDGTMSDLNYPNINSIERVYDYEPTQGLNPELIKFVLGVQANMWPAVPQEVKDINVQNFPRLLALAEIAWTEPRRRNLENFKERLTGHYPRLEDLGIEYYKEGGYTIGNWTPEDLKAGSNIKEWDVTTQTTTTGRIQVGFFFTGGDSFLQIQRVTLLEDGNPIAEDVHLGIADRFRGIPYKKDMFLYNFALDTFNPKAKYTIRAQVSGTQGNDSFGNVTYSLAPYQPPMLK
jgi:hexosaminidase